MMNQLSTSNENLIFTTDQTYGMVHDALKRPGTLFCLPEVTFSMRGQPDQARLAMVHPVDARDRVYSIIYHLGRNSWCLCTEYLTQRATSYQSYPLHDAVKKLEELTGLSIPPIKAYHPGVGIYSIRERPDENHPWNLKNQTLYSIQLQQLGAVYFKVLKSAFGIQKIELADENGTTCIERVFPNYLGISIEEWKSLKVISSLHPSERLLAKIDISHNKGDLSAHQREAYFYFLDLGTQYGYTYLGGAVVEGKMDFSQSIGTLQSTITTEVSSDKEREENTLWRFSFAPAGDDCEPSKKECAERFKSILDSNSYFCGLPTISAENEIVFRLPMTPLVMDKVAEALKNAAQVFQKNIDSAPATTQSRMRP